MCQVSDLVTVADGFISPERRFDVFLNDGDVENGRRKNGRQYQQKNRYEARLEGESFEMTYHKQPNKVTIIWYGSYIT